jgi:hypothetical protein
LSIETLKLWKVLLDRIHKNKPKKQPCLHHIATLMTDRASKSRGQKAQVSAVHATPGSPKSDVPKQRTSERIGNSPSGKGKMDSPGGKGGKANSPGGKGKANSPGGKGKANSPGGTVTLTKAERKKAAAEKKLAAKKKKEDAKKLAAAPPWQRQKV